MTRAEKKINANDLLAQYSCTGKDLELEERRTKTVNNVTCVYLFNFKILELRREEREMTVFPTTPATRKSVRLLNSLIRPLRDDVTILTRNGEWFIRWVDKSLFRLTDNTRIPY